MTIQPINNGESLASVRSKINSNNEQIPNVVVAVTQSATPSVNVDNGDTFKITGLAQAITSMTTNLSGTPIEWQMALFDITDNGTARAITRGSSFSNTTLSRPTTTVASTKLRALGMWNGTTWDCVWIV